MSPLKTATRHQLFPFYFTIIHLFVHGQVYAQESGQKVILSQEYQQYFDRYAVKGSLVVYDLKNNKTFYYDEERTKMRYSPASTFKIFNSLVGLETGIIRDTSYVIPWDGVRRGSNAAWNRSNSLKSAFKYSVVWYYQELARRIGKESMQKFLSDNHYGNEDINTELDAFWLGDPGGKLRISQVEQIDFLRKLYDEELNFSERSQRLVKGIMLVEDNGEYRLFAKTGMCRQGDLHYGWYVGWIETNENAFFFATHFEAADYKNILSGGRQGITLAALRDLGMIREGP